VEVSIEQPANAKVKRDRPKPISPWTTAGRSLSSHFIPQAIENEPVNQRLAARQVQRPAPSTQPGKPNPMTTTFRALYQRLSVVLAFSLPLAVFGQDTVPAKEQYGFKTNILYRAESELTDYMRERCRLDIHYPKLIEDFPTVVWFHGGGLKGGNRSVPTELQEQGIAVVAVNYRLHPHVQSPSYVEDAAAAVAWTFENIESFGGSAGKIFVSGHSAGGYLTSMVGMDKRWLGQLGIDADRIAGLIPYSGHTITHFTIRDERGIAGTQPIVDDMAPLFHVRPDAPPILLISGDSELEMLGRYEENAYFWRMLQVVGHPDARILELDGYDHGGMAGPAHPLLLKFVRRVSEQK
jgi:acetyl esterase/lipase